MATVLLQTLVLPDYDYIDGPESSTITNSQQNHQSAPEINIYSVPDSDTLLLMNKSTKEIVRCVNDAPSPYETPNEPIYEDPGVQKEKIYEWFDKKKFRKLKHTELK